MKKIDIADYGYRGSYEGEFTVGRICSQEKGMYTLVSEFGEQQAVILGKLRFSAKCPSDFPTVGDFVLSDCQNGENQAVIHEILPRKSVFIRKTAGENDSQAVGANIDTIFICMSLNNDFNIRRLERYISAAWDSGAAPVVLLTKADLCEDLPRYISEVSQIALGIEIITLCAVTDDVPKKLLPYIGHGKTAAFPGSSGVGKSTIINRLLGENRITTNGLRNDAKGRHTTTRRELFMLKDGSMVIDTPGMRELGLWNASDGLQKSFSDIEELAKRCRFSDCTHTAEPHCAVREAVQNGEISAERLASFKKLMKENMYTKNEQEYLLQKKEKFKQIAKINKRGNKK